MSQAQAELAAETSMVNELIALACEGGADTERAIALAEETEQLFGDVPDEDRDRFRSQLIASARIAGAHDDAMRRVVRFANILAGRDRYAELDPVAFAGELARLDAWLSDRGFGPDDEDDEGDDDPLGHELDDDELDPDDELDDDELDAELDDDDDDAAGAVDDDELGDLDDDGDPDDGELDAGPIRPLLP